MSDRLKEIEGRLSSATQGEWNTWDCRSRNSIGILSRRPSAHIPAVDICEIDLTADSLNATNDAEFIAHAPRDISWLIICVKTFRSAADVMSAEIATLRQAAEAMRASSQHYRLRVEELEKTAKQAEDYIDKYRALKDACVNLVIERDELRRIVNEQNADLEAYRRAYPNASEWDNE